MSIPRMISIQKYLKKEMIEENDSDFKKTKKVQVIEIVPLF